jgi:hypothetical protein
MEGDYPCFLAIIAVVWWIIIFMSIILGCCCGLGNYGEGIVNRC